MQSLRSFALLLGLPLLLGLVGCDCGGGGGGLCTMACPNYDELCCAATLMCVQTTNPCDSPETCVPGSITFNSRCETRCHCELLPPLAEGPLAHHLDMAELDDGTLVLSGWSPGNPPGAEYQDLVFGTYDATEDVVRWEAIDGVPDVIPTGNPTGWRGGVSRAGDDVGRYSSIANDGDTIWISYYDKTHGALKVARRSGGTWSFQTVDDEGDAGQFTSLVLLDDGRAVIAYMSVLPPAGEGTPTGRVRIATSTSASPASPSDWTFAELGTGPVPCRLDYCNAGQTCLDTGECVTAPPPDAGVIDGEHIDDWPLAIGLFNALAPVRTGAAITGIGLVFHDRTTGNLRGATLNTSTGLWSPVFLIDGYARNAPGVGDCGYAADLFVDPAGVWHVAYIDGSEEILRYARIQGGAVLSRETIDDGIRMGEPKHIVGDDASVGVTGTGQVRVAYYDATSHDAIVAVRGTMVWTIHTIDNQNADTGLFTVQLVEDDVSTVAMHWRQLSDPGRGTSGTRIVTFTPP